MASPVIRFRASKEFLERLDAAARAANQTRSAYIRQAIQAWMKLDGGDRRIRRSERERGDYEPPR